MMKLVSSVGVVTCLASSALFCAPITIGYFDQSREVIGFSGAVFPHPNPYLSQAAQYLRDRGHTLVATNSVDASFLSGVDAFYTGLVGSVSANEISALQDFVNVQGGFLFAQTEWATASTWTPAADSILGAFGIAHNGSYFNDSGNHTVGSSDWVSSPNVVTDFAGGLHSTITSTPSDFIVLANDDLNRPILGVRESGAGRAGDVLVATDINFWDDLNGWKDARNQALWNDIWSTAADRISERKTTSVPDGGYSLALALATIVPLVGFARRRNS